MATHVSTPHGSGVIAAYDPQSKLYDVTIGETVMKLPRKDLLVEAADDRSSEEEEDTTPVIPQNPLIKQMKRKSQFKWSVKVTQ